MSAVNEFARAYRLDTLGGERRVQIAADEGERTALARRFGLVSIDRLEADAALRREGDVVWAEGEVSAVYGERCVATGDTLPGRQTIPFKLRFVPETDEASEDEVELSDDDCDTLTHDGAAIDLGEAVAQSFALSLDPFPRGPDADAALRDAGVLGEEDAGPFAALKALKDKLG